MENISIIVPVFNTEKYLHECVESIINQTYKNLEIILIDDGSTDNSGKICDAFSERDSRVIVIHKINEGVAKARAAGVSIASSEYVMFMDSDDWIDADTVELSYLEVIQYNRPDIINYGYVFSDITINEKRLDEFEQKLYEGKIKNEIIDKAVFKSSLSMLWNKLCKKSIVEQYIYKVPKEVVYMEDCMVGIPCVLSAKSIFVSRRTPYHYRQRADSAMHTYAELPQTYFKALYSLCMENIARTNEFLQIDIKRAIFEMAMIRGGICISPV